MSCHVLVLWPWADPGFPRGVATPKGAPNYYFLKNALRRGKLDRGERVQNFTLYNHHWWQLNCDGPCRATWGMPFSWNIASKNGKEFSDSLRWWHQNQVWGLPTEQYPETCWRGQETWNLYVTFIERFVHFKLISQEPMSLFSSDSWHAWLVTVN